MTTPPPNQTQPAQNKPAQNKRVVSSEYDDSEALAEFPRQRFAAAHVLVAVAFSLLVSGCLGSGSLVGLAERQDLGWQRDVALTGAEANDRVASFFSLDRPADALASIIDDPEDEIDLEDFRETTTVPVADDVAASPVATAPATTTTTLPPGPIRTLSAETPLQLYVGGDSLARDLGEALARVTPVELVTPEQDGQVSSGLSRPDFLDWPQRLAQVANRDVVPEGMVIMFGANDYQSVEPVRGTVLTRGSPEWATYYAEQVALAMDVTETDSAVVFWVGLPPIRDDKIPAEGVVLMNRIYSEAAEARPWVTYIDAFAPFAGDSGGFASSINGVSVRQDDGIHLNFAGINQLAEIVWTQLRVRWPEPAPIPPPTTTPGAGGSTTVTADGAGAGG